MEDLGTMVISRFGSHTALHLTESMEDESVQSYVFKAWRIRSSAGKSC